MLRDDSEGRLVISVYNKSQKKLLTPSARNRLTRYILKLEKDEIVRSNLGSNEQLKNFE